MSSAHWQQIEKLFHAALECEPSERAAFLSQACGEDAGLRSAVESLLAHHEQAKSFIESPAVAAVDALDNKNESLMGRTIVNYRIVEMLGEGGMGEVYLAVDTRLNRKVAIKFLPADLEADVQARRRLMREAQAAAALDHPNICVVHEVGEAEGSSFIVMQYVDGETLDCRLKRRPLELREALEIAAQTADALAEAHARSITHRDIKPANIMVRSDGLVKVLDFGLAKLTERVPPDMLDTEALAQADTAPGIVMGTATYMSPEQAKGIHVDARTDLWSLGAVLYEMVTGHLPFAGETPTETISLILQTEPPPLTRYVSEAPGELQRFVAKALTKGREERYQTAKEMLIDLHNLKRDLEVDAEMAPEFRRSVSTRSTSGKTPSAFAPGSAAPTAPTGATATASSAEYVVSGLKQHKLAAVIAGLVLIVGAIGLATYLRARNAEAAIDSVAVLPFVNQSGDPNTEYLSDGLTESVINSLTQLSKLKVIARSSVFRYKGKDIDPLSAGHDLGVRAVLTGRLLQRGDSLMVSTELLDVRDNKQLWGEQYNRRVADALAVQQDISREITERLRLKLTGEEQKQLAERDTANPEAYQFYLKGRYHWDKRTPVDLRIAVGHFQQAIEKDPNYALADSGLADAYALLPVYFANPPSETMPKAKAAALKALDIDGNLAEAHASLSGILSYYDWDFSGALRELDRAIELNPNYASAHQWRGELLSALGRTDEAFAEHARALELDPLSLIMNRVLADTLYNARRYDEAIEQCRKTIEMDPNFTSAHLRLGAFYEAKGMYREAVAEYARFEELAINLHGENSQVSAEQAAAHQAAAAMLDAYAKGGWKGYLRYMLATLKEQAKQRYIPPFSIAEYYAELGQTDEAFAWLEKGHRDRDPSMTILKVDPKLDSLRTDPRFDDLMRRVGLPQ